MEGITPDANPQYDGVPLDPPPSTRQGFGRAHLGRSLPLAANPSGWSMQVLSIASQTLSEPCSVARLQKNYCEACCATHATAIQHR